MRRTLLLPGLVCFLCLFAAGASRAQRPIRPVLADALPQLVWDAAERGPLLIVAPDKTYAPTLPPLSGTSFPLGVQPDPPPPNGYRPNPLAERFSRQVTPVGTLTAFTPTTMTTLTADHLPKPNIYAELTEGDRMHLFQASLTEDQWRKLASPDGLGAGDLKPDQRDLFLALLPNPMTIHRTIDESGDEPIIEATILTDAQRSAVRLHQRRRLNWQFRTENGGFLGEGDPRDNPLYLVDSRWVDRRMGKASVFGAMVKNTVPNRQKPSHLRYDWSALDARIALADVGTIGALVERIRSVTRVEIYADRRYAELSVYVRGESARAGDILRALALCVTGTYRKVGPAFVLTDDLIGLGTRHAILQAWVDHALIGLQALVDSIMDAADKMPPAALTWADDDPMKPSEDVRRRIEAIRRIDKNTETIPIRDLPPAARDAITKQLEELRINRPRFASQGENDRDRLDSVVAVPGTTTELIVPGIGVVRADMLTNGTSYRLPVLLHGVPRNNATPTPPPAVADLPNIPKHGIVLMPNTEAEAVKAVMDAKRRGFTTLWISIAPDDDTKPLKAAIHAGKEAGIPIVAVVRVLRSGSDTALPADINVRGETSSAVAVREARDGVPRPLDGGPRLVFDTGFVVETERRDAVAEATRERKRGAWLRCDLPDVRAKIATRVAAIARISGLAGLALLDLVPPGYRGAALYPGGAGGNYLENGFGYSEEMRLAFLRQNSVDPVDLSTLREAPNLTVSLSNRVPLDLPFFPDYGLAGKYASRVVGAPGGYTSDLGARDAAEKWLEFRIAVGNDWIRQLVTKVQSAAPNLPLYGTSDSEPPTRYDWRWLALLGIGKAAAAYLAPAPMPAQAWPFRSGMEPYRSPNRRDTPADTIRVGAKEAWLVAAYLPETSGNPALNFALQMRQAMRVGQGPQDWDGVLLDLSESSVDSAFSLVDAVIKMPDAAPRNGGATKPP